MMRISLAQQIDELERELAKRREAYPRIIASRPSMTSTLEFQEARLVASIATLRWLQAHEDLIRQRLAY